MSQPLSTENTQIPQQLTPLSGGQLYIQLGLFLIVRTIINSGFRMVYPFLPFIARGLGVSVADVTWGITLRSSLGLASPIIGLFADKWGRKRAMMIGSFVFIISMMIVFVSPTYPALMISLILTTIGKIMFDTSVYAYIGDRVEYRQRGFASGIAEFGWSGAFLLGIPFAGFLIGRIGWNSPFLFFGLIAFGIFILLWRSLPNESAEQHLRRPSILNGFKIIRNEPAALALLAIAFLITTSNEAINVVYGSWMEDSFALKVAALGLASTVIGIAELFGEGLVAGFVDRLGKRRSLGIGLILYAVSCLLLPVLAFRIEIALVGLFFFFLTFEFALVSSLPLITETVPAARATLVALGAACHSLGRMAGSIIGPQLFVSGLFSNAVVASALTAIAILLLISFVKERVQTTYEVS